MLFISYALLRCSVVFCSPFVIQRRQLSVSAAACLLAAVKIVDKIRVQHILAT